jgi:uncharacterized membrane protein/predicted DsbA family dithiol-disulfide isomerase
MLVLLYALALLGLGTSSLLLVDYLRPLPIFCDGGGGCDIVRQSEYAQVLGVKTPVLGVVFFVGVLLLALWPARRLLLAWAGAGALAALVFVAVQAFVLHAFCKFCMVADGSTIALFVVAIATRRRPAPGGKGQLLVGAGAIACAFAPFLYARTLPPPLPAALVQIGLPDVLLGEQRPGVATIIEFVDFECPFCRRLHQTLSDVMKEYEGRVRLVRKQHPLSFHSHAATAARAACCADQAGQGDRMAEALYGAPPTELTTAGCEKLATDLGIDLEAYRACVASEDTTRRLASDAAEAKAAGLAEEAPVFWIGDVRYRGAMPPDVIRDGIERALRR